MQTTNKQSLTIDIRKRSLSSNFIEKTNVSQYIPQFVQGDTNILEAVIKDDGVDADLSNVGKVIANFKRQDRTVVSRSATKTGNVVTYTMGNEEMAKSGIGELELQFFNADDTERISTLRFKVNVMAEIGVGLEGEDGPTLVQELVFNGDYAKTQGDYAKSSGDTALTNWLSPVASYSAVTSISNPKLGDTVQTNDDGKVYRYNGSQWKYTQGYSSTALANVNAQLAENEQLIQNKKSFHASKAFGKLKRGEPAKIVFLGDSTTEQNSTTNGQPNHVSLLTTWLQGLYPGLVTVVNAGISGHSITLMLERLQKDVLSHNPDLVIVCSGINDQGGTYAISLDEFKKNYDLLIREIISQNNTDIILRTPNVVMSSATSDAIDVYNEVTRSLAIKYDLGLFDLFKLMKKDIADGEISVLTTGPFLNDSVHPNENGHQYIYENFKTFFEPKEFIHKPLTNRKMISAKGGFRHVGGTEFAGVSYVNGYTLLFNQPNKRISFEYDGEDFTIVYGSTTGTGQFKVYVDGVQIGDIVDTYSPTVKYRNSVSYSVSPGKHLVEIECQSTKNASSSSTNLQIQAVIYKKENRINEGLIPLPYSYLDVRATATIALTDGVEKTFIFNSVPFNVGDIASYNLSTGEITFSKSGLYQIYFSNRFVTEPDKSLEANYKVNNTTIKRAYSRTPNSVIAATPSISLDLTDIRVLNVGDVLKFSMNAQGTSPTNSAYAVIVKLG